MTPAKRFLIVFPLLAIALTVAMAAVGGQAGPTAQAIDPADFSTTIDHPFFPLSSLGPKVFEGEEVDPDTGEVITLRLESQVLPTTQTVAGVETLVLEERAYQNGELVEVTRDYFAQHTDGTVYYFGENVDNYILGVIDNHDGTWLAGEGSNMPGIIMPTAPFVGQTYAQEIAPGIAEDQGEVVALGEAVGTAAGEFIGCLKVKDTNPLEPGVEEFKFWCPGVGLARTDSADGFEELVSYSTTGGGTPTASPTASPDGSPTVTPSPTASPTPTASATPTGTPSAATLTPTPAVSDDDDDEDVDDQDEDEDADEAGDADDDDDDEDDDDDDGGADDDDDDEDSEDDDEEDDD